FHARREAGRRDGRSLHEDVRAQVDPRSAVHARVAPRDHEGVGRSRADRDRRRRSGVMQLLERIEKRRFVGREWLLWLWFESEISEATLRTAEHGEFGLWIERVLVLSATKNEVTRIKGALPASAREAKEALLLGKLPESAGLRLTWREHES